MSPSPQAYLVYAASHALQFQRCHHHFSDVHHKGQCLAGEIEQAWVEEALYSNALSHLLRRNGAQCSFSQDLGQFFANLDVGKQDIRVLPLIAANPLSGNSMTL
jgi:hypothetical protein